MIDWSTELAGLRAAGMLADYGADVVRVVSPHDADDPTTRGATSVYNRGKRLLLVDSDSVVDCERVLELLSEADVLVETWAPNARVPAGAERDALRLRFPQLVHCSITGFGHDGPHVDVMAHEALVHALIGTMGEQPGFRDAPIYEGLPFATIGAAYLASIGIAAALYRRHYDGAGRWVDTSLLDGALAYLTMLWGDADIPPPARDPGSLRLIARNFECLDGTVLGVHTGALGAFGRLMQVLGLDDRVPPSETGLDMGMRLTPEQRTLLDESLPRLFATKTGSAWVDELTRADICAIPLNEPMTVFDEEQVRHNGMVIELEDPVLGRIEQVAPALRFARTPFDPPIAVQAPSGQVTWRDRAARLERHLDPVDETRPLLDGLRVLDLGAFYAGPYGSRVLADLGADVIRVETLLGDPNRGSERIFRASHAGKRSIAVDLKTDAGRLVVEHLITWADVVHHTMRPGADGRLGVDYERAATINPDVVYAHGPGWGSSGPLASRQSFAPLMSGFVGVAFEVAGQFNPPVYPTGNEDPGNGLLGAFGMLLGTLHRLWTGEGQRLEHPQLNAALAQMAHVVRRADGEPIGAMRLDPVQLGVGPLDRLYQTADGWICLVASTTAELVSIGKIIGHDFADDARFDDAAGRDLHRDELENVLTTAFGTRSSNELLDDLRSVGVSAALPVPYNNERFLSDPENLRTGRAAECPDEHRGAVREVGVLVRASKAGMAPHRLAPALGADTDQILADLGYSPDETSALRAARVVG